MGDDELDRGLEHALVAETRLSAVDGEAGELVIAGYPLEELAPNATFEETLYLLHHDRLPTADELDAFRAELAGHRELPAPTRLLLRVAAAADVPAMDALRMGAASASLVRETGEGTLEGMGEPDGAGAPGGGEPPEGDGTPEADALVCIAQFPTVVAAYHRLRTGDPLVEPDPELSHAANFLSMLTGEEPTDAQVRGLDTYLNTVVDHGLNASTFTARTIVSTESDVISAVTGAVGALKGPLHGGAPGPVLEMLREVEAYGDREGAPGDREGAPGDREEAPGEQEGAPGDSESYLRAKLEAGERLMGFGHRVYRVRDPRADVLSQAAERFYEASDETAFFELATEVEETAVELLAERHPDRQLETNVEFYTALLLHGIGIPDELFSATFAISRVGGWTAHCLEQLADNRLIRPRSRYVGKTGREWVPVEHR